MCFLFIRRSPVRIRVGRALRASGREFVYSFCVGRCRGQDIDGGMGTTGQWWRERRDWAERLEMGDGERRTVYGYRYTENMR